MELVSLYVVCLCLEAAGDIFSAVQNSRTTEAHLMPLVRQESNIKSNKQPKFSRVTDIMGQTPNIF